MSTNFPALLKSSARRTRAERAEKKAPCESTVLWSDRHNSAEKKMCAERKERGGGGSVRASDGQIAKMKMARLHLASIVKKANSEDAA